MKVKPDRAPIIAPPPLLALACIGLAFVGRHFKPLPLYSGSEASRMVVGSVLIASAIGIFIAARGAMAAHGTDPNPYRPTHAVVVTGLYRFSRNPIYIAFLLVVLAFAFFANSFWFVIGAGLLLFILRFGVIDREERYLGDKFGAQYTDYCRRVRRWF